ncbi:MAG TPA: glycoside hydrolase, partial [Polyangia bacterium]
MPYIDETGNAQCGGAPGISDAFAGSLWWLDELGRLARRGTPVVVRQSLSGADYGLLREPSLDPRPDYFASLLWRRLMGRRVLAVAAAPP